MDTLKVFKKIKIRDIKDLLIFLLLLPIGYILSKFNKNVWLVSERPDEARDNGYWFFKYVHDNKLHKHTFYVINKTSLELEKLTEISPRNIIYFGSLKHYLFYIIAEIQISAHIGGGMINSSVISFLEKYKLINNKKVFLQHGITKNKIDWAFRKNANIDLFCCASKREVDFITTEFGYDENQAVLTGFCRYDNLNNYTMKNQILLMPTWRKNLKYKGRESNNNFNDTNYFKAYQQLINNKMLMNLLDEYGYEMIFYLHPEMQHYLDNFEVKNPRLILANKDSYDLQILLKESNLLITDYSSVFFDFAYMNKPTINFHFDYSDYRASHWEEGYFNYETDVFGPVVNNEYELLKQLESYIKNNCEIEEEYSNKAREFFSYYDKNNCARTFKLVNSL
ncbi:CDP-glycerol glycerophosphotransferase family protein [Sporosarcina sp. G11-34]|uniref:CDP-glycerol glycerophosphotransferase family protein n=1 Tax=Sporosarcina sp. G11-34 TaxID=2849605 RepID=UPI0022A957AD|nr:CDP-glycerol glycerophosphotransferase family protein [Sporosarcina sp. G11-34]MCZ2257305.1 CDP-glycerol glycerophosphotransferase family protein [Sporosarcina sp. G11-34]